MPYRVLCTDVQREGAKSSLDLASWSFSYLFSLVRYPQVILLAAFSRPRSRCYPLLNRPAVLRLVCADETSSAQWTSCVLPCNCRHYAGKRQGTVAVQVATMHLCKLSCCQDVIAPLSRNSTRTVTLLAVHAVDAYEEECDESFHARHYTLLLRCAGVPSAPPHDK